MSDVAPKMGVLLVVSSDEEIGGVPYVVGNLARYLKGRGHHVTFLIPGRANLLEQKVTKLGFPCFEINLQMPIGERHPLISLALFAIRFPIAVYQLISLICRERIQVVNPHFPADCFCYLAVCRLLVRIRLVTSVHGADFFPGGRPKTRYSWASRFLLRVSDVITVPSRAYRKDFLSLFPQLEGKTTAIHNGVNIEELGFVYREDGQLPFGRYILCVAAHNEKKGIDTLLQAFALLRTVDASVKLVLAGDGPLRPQLEELGRSLGIDREVIFLGQKGRSDVVGLLRGCELFVLPSRSEPFGIAVIEALACRKPVVSTKVGGILEIIEDGVNGVLVEPDDPNALAEAIVTMLASPILQRLMGENGYNSVQKSFLADNTGAAYEATYASLINPSTVSQPMGSPSVPGPLRR
jgi:glycosyltransferase involved in cell wall biosynthesis